MRVEQLMTKDVWTCRPSTPLNEAVRILWERDCGSLPVLDEESTGRVVGMLTDRDVCMAAYTTGRCLGELRADQAMAREVATCDPSEDVAVASERMRDTQLRRLPVVDASGQIVGMLSLADVALAAGRAARQADLASVGRALAAVSQPRTHAAA